MPLQLLTTGKAARLCSVRPDTVLKWIKKGRLTAARTAGGHYRIDERDLHPMLSQPEQEEAEAEAKESTVRPPLRCWEYLGEEVCDECRNCVAFRTRSAWCFELVKAVRGTGHGKRFCTGACQDCPYYRRVQALPANVLLVSRDESLIQNVAKRTNGCVAFRYARCGYDASAIISVFRPALVVVDQCVLEGGDAGLLEALANDARAPGARILLGTRKGRAMAVPAGNTIDGSIEVPFCCDDIARWLERLPVEMLAAPEKPARRAVS